MKTAKQIFDETMGRVKRLQMFEVKRELPLNWMPNGTMPFDMKASNGVGTFIVYAEFLQDAEDQVSQFLERDEDE